MSTVIGWDIGGVNTKAALVTDGVVMNVITRPFELQRAPQALGALLREMARALASDAPDAHAVTMTAELSQMFRTKREGVDFILEAAGRAFPGAELYVYSTDGAFVSRDEARMQPLAIAAANWVATAHLVAPRHPDALLVDVGTTTTDLIPISGGAVVAHGRTDPERLASGELVYTGAVRTPVEAVVRQVPIGGMGTRVSVEAFALTGDVHVWLGDLAPADYEAATPDGRPATRSFAGERLSRVVCADRDLLDDAAITGIAATVAQAQIAEITDAIREVLNAHVAIGTAVVTGLGAFIGVRAARAAGLQVIPLADQLGAAGARSAPATAVALLLEERLEAGLTTRAPQNTWRRTAAERSLTIIKLGGSLLADPQQWRAAVRAIASAAASQMLLVVPGGGPFADAVRNVDAAFRLPDDAAHWMAIAAMDQHADMIAAAGAGFVRVLNASGSEAAHDRGLVPVLAPHHWMREVDPLPHSWD